MQSNGLDDDPSLQYSPCLQHGYNIMTVFSSFAALCTSITLQGVWVDWRGCWEGQASSTILNILIELY